MDNLARDCAMALKAGMSYGQWKALHPYTKWEGSAQRRTDFDRLLRKDGW